MEEHKDEEKSAEEIVVDIQNACAKLGWNIALIDADNVHGLIIGRNNYVANVISQLEEDYDIYNYPGSEDQKVH